MKLANRILESVYSDIKTEVIYSYSDKEAKEWKSAEDLIADEDVRNGYEDSDIKKYRKHYERLWKEIQQGKIEFKG